MSHSMGEDVRRTLRGTAANYVAALLQTSVFVFHVLAARLFGRTAYGAYIFAWSLVEMGCKVGVMGMDKGMLRGVAAARARGDEAAEVLVPATGLKVATAASLVVIGALWWVAWVQETPEYGSAVLALSPLVLTWSLTLVFVSATMATGTMRYNLIVRGLIEPAALVAMVLIYGLCVVDGRETGVALSHLSASALAALAGAWAFSRRSNARAVTRAALSEAPDRSLVRFALPVMVAELLNQSIYRLDIVFLGLFLADPKTVASYGAAVLIAGVISSIRYAFDPVLSPLVAECVTRGERERLAANLTRMTRWVLILSLPVFSTVVVFGDTLLGLWGPGYADLHVPLVILAVAHLVNAALGLHQWPVVMSGRSRLDLRNNTLGFVVTVGLHVTLIPTWGATGAAIATLVGNLVYRGLQVTQVRAFFRINPFNHPLFKVGLGGALVVGTQAAVRSLATDPGVGVFAVACACGVLVMAAAVRLSGPVPEDRDMLRALFRRCTKQP